MTMVQLLRIGENSRYSMTTSKWNKPILGYYIYNSSSHLTFTERENAIRAAFDFFLVSDRCSTE
jgi:hypothetical protein